MPARSASADHYLKTLNQSIFRFDRCRILIIFIRAADIV
jgi:hypothetical protein